MPEKIDNIPSLLIKYEGKEDLLFTALVKKYGDEPIDPYYNADVSDEENDVDISKLSIKDDKKKRRGVSAKKKTSEDTVDTRIIIQKISRNRKKATTVVIGMDTVPGVKLKDVSKKFSKRFAGSSSVKDNQGTKEIIIQGDHTEEVAAFIIKSIKGIRPDSVFLDLDGEFVPFG